MAHKTRTISSVLVATTGIQVLINLVMQSVPAMGPRLINALEISTQQYGLLVGCISAGNMLVLAAGGHLGDRLGGRRVLSGAAFACAALMVLIAQLSSFVGLAALLTVTGMAIGTTMSAGGGAVFASAPAGRRGFLIGIRQVGLPAGGIIAAILVPPLLGHFDWRAVFLTEGATFVVAGSLVLRVPFAQPSAPATTDAPRRLSFRQVRALTVLGLLGALLGGAQWGFLAYLTVQLTGRFHLSFGLASLIFLCAQVGGGVSRVALGWASDRLSGDRVGVLTVNSLLGAGAMLLLSLLGSHTSLAILIAIIAVSGFFVLGWNSVLITAFAETSPARTAGLGIGVGLTFVRVGTVSAPYLLGLAAVARTPALFTVLAAILLVSSVGLAAYWCAGHRHRPPAAQAS